MADFPQQYYAGWDAASAQADWEAKGKNLQALQQARGYVVTPSGQEVSADYGQPKSPESIVNDIMAAQEEQIERESGWLEQYTVEHPFAFDEELARVSAEAEYQPYYSELLEDYLSGVELRKETVQDEKKFLQEMGRLQKGERSRSYTRAVSRASEGFAGSGMFFSGIKKRALGEAEVEYGAGEREAGLRYGLQERGLGRQATALGLEEEQRRRGLGREEEEAVEAGTLTRRGEALTQYYVPFTQAYKRQFPTGAVGVEGYLPEEYLMHRY